jgi:hypothetical protein
MKAAPLPTSPTVQGQKTNDGVSKLAIHLEDFTSGRIVVVFTPAGRPQTPSVKPLEKW